MHESDDYDVDHQHDSIAIDRSLPIPSIKSHTESSKTLKENGRSNRSILYHTISMKSDDPGTKPADQHFETSSKTNTSIGRRGWRIPATFLGPYILGM